MIQWKIILYLMLASVEHLLSVLGRQFFPCNSLSSSSLETAILLTSACPLCLASGAPGSWVLGRRQPVRKSWVGTRNELVGLHKDLSERFRSTEVYYTVDFPHFCSLLVLGRDPHKIRTAFHCMPLWQQPRLLDSAQWRGSLLRFITLTLKYIP